MQPIEVERSSSSPSSTPVGGHDLPDPDNDDLGRDALARAIQRVIANTPPGWSSRLALTGEWGSGKSTVLQLLKRRLRQESNCEGAHPEDGRNVASPVEVDEARIPLVLELSVWGQQRESDLLDMFLKRLTQGMEDEGIKPDRGLQNAMREWGGWLPFLKKTAETAAAAGESLAMNSPEGAACAAVAGWARSAAFEYAWTKLDDWLKVRKEEFAKHLLTLASQGKSVVVFIDDLDRADPRTIPQTLFALREILNMPNFTFVLAYDEEIVTQALREYSIACGDRADQFLEKIVDMTFPLSEPSAHGVAVLACRMMEECCYFIPVEVREETAQYFPPNPRLTKLIARTLGALKEAAERHGPHELNWRAIVLQTILQAALPKERVQQIEHTFLGSECERSLRLTPTLLEDVLGEEVPKSPPAKREAQIASWVRSRPGRLTADRAQRLFDEVRSSRAEDTKAKVRYEMSLLKEEPTFTMREFEDLVAAIVDGQDCSGLLKERMKRAQMLSRRHPKEVAADLVDKAINGYEASTRMMAQSIFDHGRHSGAQSVAQVLTLLESLWAEFPLSEDIRRSTAQQQRCELLLTHLAARAEEGEIAPESELCGRARRLAGSVIARADSPLRLYLWSRLQSNSSFHEEWMSVGLRQRAVDEALLLFRNKETLMSALRPDPSGLWFVCSADSPLFSPEHVGKLVAVFQRFAASEDGHIRDEGARLARLLFIRQKEEDDHLRSPERFQPAWAAMWSAVCAAPTTPSLKNSVAELRRWLVGVPGIDPQQFGQPAWLNVS